MEKNTRRTISIMLTIAMMFSLIAINMTSVSAAVTMTTKDGFLKFEAEDIPYDKTAFELVSGDKIFSNSKGLAPTNEDKTVPATGDPAHLDLTFKGDKAGSYNIWVRHTASVADMAGQTVFMSINGGAYTGTMLTAEPTEPKWVKLGTAKVDADGGEGKVKLRTRQKISIVLDYFVITNDTTYIPDDSKVGITTSAPTKTAPPAATPRPSGAKAAEFSAKSGYAMFEAEKTTIIDGYSEKSVDSASGGVVLNTPKDGSMNPLPTDPGDLEFGVKADKDGSYTLWANISPTTVNKTIAVSVNGAAYKTVSVGAPENAYAWRNLGTTAGIKSGDTINYRIRTRNGYFDIDNFVITDNRKAKPDGISGKLLEGTAATLLPDNLYPKPTFAPPSEHPRLYFMKKDIPKILDNAKKPQNAEAWKKHQENIAKDTDGSLREPTAGGSNMDNTILGIIESYAFEYVTANNEVLGKKAISAMKTYMEQVVYIDPFNDGYTRNAGHTLFTMAQVYDWCYPLLTQADKDFFIDQTETTVTDGIELRWPPTNMGSVTSHGSEAQLLRDVLSVSVALYNERPDIYNVVGGRFFADYLPARQFAYPSGMWHQGTGYGVYRGQWDYNSTWIFDRMGLPNVYGLNADGKSDQQYIMYWYFYMRRPDGQILRDGDAGTNGAEIGAYNTGLVRTLMLAANYYKDPYLKQEMMRESNFLKSFNVGHGNMSCVEFLCFNDPDLGGEPVSQLPQTRYFPAPMGNMIARTGWEDGLKAPATIAHMKINEVWFANHHHQDAGHFQLYYKGLLSGDTGRYEGYGTPHDYVYNKRTIAHNTMLVKDPGETITYVNITNNDGGQRAPYNAGERNHINMFKAPDSQNNIGKVTGHEFGPDPIKPDYSYMSGDLTKAYSDTKMENFDRSFMFLDLKNSTNPAALVVFDRVDSKNASFKKTFLLHMPVEPEVSGNKTVVKNTENGYNGKMTVDTLLPKSDNTAIEIIGGPGKEFWVDGQNYPGPTTLSPTKAHESDGWRIEISPKKASKTDYFLNVLQVGDAEPDIAPLAATLIENDAVAGVKIADRVAIFAKSKDLTKDNLNFDVAGDGTFQITVSGLVSGTWKVTKGGVGVGSYVATQDGSMVVFDGGSGSYALSYESASGTRPNVTATPQDHEGIDIKINKKFLYTDVPATVVNDRTLVPMRAIFEAMGATVDWDSITQTVTATNGTTTVKLTLDSTTAYVNDTAVTLDVPAMLVKDRTMVPIRFVSESMGATVEWDGFAKTVLIDTAGVSTTKSEYPPLMKVTNALTIYKLTQSGDDGEGNAIGQSVDGDLLSRWAVQGTELDAWGVYDLGSTKTLDSVHLAFYNGNARVYTFSIDVSEDGISYTRVIDNAKTSGKTNELEKYDMKGVKARYVKYLGYGNSSNDWNSMTEIAIVEKK